MEHGYCLLFLFRFIVKHSKSFAERLKRAIFFKEKTFKVATKAYEREGVIVIKATLFPSWDNRKDAWGTGIQDANL